MRIISGIYKGRKLFEPLDKKTRPLKDIVKESIFNLIQHSSDIKINLLNSNILDCFSGCGSFGIECLSRGSTMVDFVEDYQLSISILEKNVNYFKLNDKSKIFKMSTENFFLNNLQNKKYDIIFFDPPFKYYHIKNLLLNVIEKKILKEKSLIILHRHKNSKDEIPQLIKILKIKNYGSSKIIFNT